MPFRTDDGRPLGELLLAQRPADGYRFEVRAGFVYDDPVSGRRYAVPARAPGAPVPDPDTPEPPVHGVTDLASVPMWMWSFIASYGRQSAPAILHDERSIVADELGDRRAALVQRREDDRVFRTALREQRVPVLRTWVMWAWVAADRERQFGGPAGLLLLVQAILGAIVVFGASVAAFWNPWWLLALPAAALAALPWAAVGLATLLLVLTGSLAVLGPLLAVHLAVLVPFRLVEAIVEVLAGGDPRSVIRPTVAPGTEGGTDG